MVSRRGILKTPQFDARVDALRPKYPRVDALVEGVTWEISISPTELGVYDTRLDIWRATHAGNLVLPRAIFFYVFTPRIVSFLTILLPD